jgi:hypothetical protein
LDQLPEQDVFHRAERIPGCRGRQEAFPRGRTGLAPHVLQRHLLVPEKREPVSLFAKTLRAP